MGEEAWHELQRAVLEGGGGAVEELLYELITLQMTHREDLVTVEALDVIRGVHHVR